MSRHPEPTTEPFEPTPEHQDLKPRSPSLLVLTDHAHIPERVRAVARELARILVTRTMLEMSVLVANDNKGQNAG